MTENKNNEDRPNARRTGNDRQQSPRNRGTRESPNADREGTVRSRPDRYLVAARPPHLLPPGMRQPLDRPDTLFDWLSQQPGTRLVSRLRRTRPSGSLAEPACPEIAVVEMAPDRANALRGSVQLLVEPDLPLSYTDPNPVVNPLALPDPDVVVPLREELRVPFLVVDGDRKPVPGVSVCLLGRTWPAQGRTGADGRVVLALDADTVDTIRGLYVRPPRDHWSVWTERPALSLDTDNVLALQRLSDTFEQFPQRQLNGWGHTAMGFDRLPPTYRAHGVRIALLDSGVDTAHPDLTERVLAGFDFVMESDRSWALDEVGHGTSCAAVVAGVDNGRGIAGIAVDAEVHACKIFPNGRSSHLIEALDYCIEHEIDIAQLSLSSPQASELVALKIADACNSGVACIAPAGNSAGVVTFPGSLPTVLTVSALGKFGEFPATSRHAAEAHGWPTPEGYFSPQFTCFGPEVNVCAPGVAIPSAVPDGYAPQDGTAVAAAHVTGLAALILAHHNGFRDWFRARNAARVSHLFQIINTNCSPLALADPNRSGAGLPDATRALGLLAFGSHVLSSTPNVPLP